MTALLPLPCSRSSLICEHSDAKGRADDTKEPTIECTSKYDFWTQLFHRRPPAATLNYCVAATGHFFVLGRDQPVTSTHSTPERYSTLASVGQMLARLLVQASLRTEGSRSQNLILSLIHI